MHICITTFNLSGGILVFDEKDIHLNVEIILITDGGILKVRHVYENQVLKTIRNKKIFANIVQMLLMCMSKYFILR